MEDLTDILRLLNVEKNKKDVVHNNGAFIPKGLKALKYWGENLLEVLEVDTQQTYLMDYTNFRRIFQALGFTERRETAVQSLLLNYRNVIIDFNKRRVMSPDDPPIPNPVGIYFSDAIENYEEIVEGQREEDPFHDNVVALDEFNARQKL